MSERKPSHFRSDNVYTYGYTLAFLHVAYLKGRRKLTKKVSTAICDNIEHAYHKALLVISIAYFDMFQMWQVFSTE